MKKILLSIFILNHLFCFGQEVKNDGNKNINRFNFSDSVELFWPNGNLKYKYINLFTKEKNGGSSLITNELFFSQKSGRLIKGNKFLRKNGMNSIVELRNKAYVIFTEKEKELKAKTRTKLESEFNRKDTVYHSVLDVLKEKVLLIHINDTIKIKHKLNIGMGYANFISYISRNEKDIFIQNYTEEIHFKTINDSTVIVNNLISDSKCKINLDVFLSKLNSEKEKCWEQEDIGKKRWKFQFYSNTFLGDEFYDFFDYNLNQFLNNYICSEIKD